MSSHVTSRPAGNGPTGLRRNRSHFIVSVLVALPLAMLAGCTDDEPVAESTSSAPRPTEVDTGSSGSPDPGGATQSTAGPESTGAGSTGPAGSCRYLDVSETGVYDLGDAGSVSLSWKEGQLKLVSTDPAEGWTARLDSDADDLDEVEVDFISGDRKVEFEAEIEDDGSLEIKVCESSRSRN